MIIQQYLASITSLHQSAHLNGISPEHPTVESFILNKGQLFTSQELTPAERDLASDLPWKQHKPKDCFRNAQTSVLTPTHWGSLKYVEGYVCPKTPMPVLHAWLTLNGKVIDTTLRTESNDNTRRVYGLIPMDWEYYGLELPVTEIFHVYEHHKTHISIIDDFTCRWPFIRKNLTGPKALISNP